MTPEEKSLLERTYKMTEENNSLLKSIRRSHRVSAVFRILYWAVIIFSGAAAYYFIQPYLNMVFGLYDQAKGGVQSAQSSFDTVENAFNSARELLK